LQRRFDEFGGDVGGAKFIKSAAGTVLLQRLILLSQKAAGNRDQNQLLGEVHTSADGG